MAHGAFDTVGFMRAGFPLVIQRLVAGGTGIPGWNQPMVNMLGLILLSNGRLDGSSQNEKNEKGGTEQTHAETMHWQISWGDVEVSDRRWTPISDADHVSPDCDLCTGRVPQVSILRPGIRSRPTVHRSGLPTQEAGGRRGFQPTHK